MNAYQYSIRLLSLRDYSEHKMRQKLLDKNYDADEIDEVIQKLIDMNYLREEEYRRMRVKTLLVKGYGNAYIIKKLQQENLVVGNSLIDDLRRENDLQELNQVDYLIQKKLRGKSIPSDWEEKNKLKAKIIRFLASKGYSFDQIKDPIDSAFKSE